MKMVNKTVHRRKVWRTPIMRKLLYMVLVLLLGALSETVVLAQTNPGEATYKVQTIFIYNFTKYVQWPGEYNIGDFVIGVLGETKLDEELKKMAVAKTVNGRKIVIKKYASINEVDKKCHILFLAAESSDLLNSVIQKTRGTSTLVVTEKNGSTKFGSLINFVSDKTGKPRFEMNLGAFEKSRLKYDSKLKSVAIPI